MKIFLLIWVLFLLIYFLAASYALDRYATSEKPIYAGYDRALAARPIDDARIECWNSAASKHIAGWDDIHFFWPPSWFEVNNRKFAESCH